MHTNKNIYFLIFFKYNFSNFLYLSFEILKKNMYIKCYVNILPYKFTNQVLNKIVEKQARDAQIILKWPLNVFSEFVEII
jgi:diketogulonate reductase-like aldo/keto reductase